MPATDSFPNSMKEPPPMSKIKDYVDFVAWRKQRDWDEYRRTKSIRVIWDHLGGLDRLKTGPIWNDDVPTLNLPYTDDPTADAIIARLEHSLAERCEGHLSQAVSLSRAQAEAVLEVLKRNR
jgi:hypothetical protein